ncbi:hypothetical protein APD01_06220 [Acinetobacter soli]|nr:hypothetical protein APD01_06220 [Acinetobacter soli]
MDLNSPCKLINIAIGGSLPLAIFFIALKAHHLRATQFKNKKHRNDSEKIKTLKTQTTFI